MPWKFKVSSKLAISIATACLLSISVTVGVPAPVSSDEATLERNFDALVHPDDLRDWMKLLAAEPNHVSSPHDKSNADQILAWFKEWGWDAHIETFSVLYPKPDKRDAGAGRPAKVHRHAAGAADSRRFQRDCHRSRAA